MSIVSPLVAEWISKGIKWTYSTFPKKKPFTIPPNSKYQIESTFKAPVGSLIYMTAAFNSPMGGISMESDPNLDFGMINSVINGIYAGNTSPNGLTYVTVPPTTPDGYYVIHSHKEWPWLHWAKLYVINTDPVNSIICYGYGYLMVYVTESLKSLKKKGYMVGYDV